MNADLSILDLRTLEDFVQIRAASRRIPAVSLSVIGLMGLLLSAVGLYGVVGYGVRQRARELGIRLALGARSSDVRWLVLRQGFTTIAIGFALGAAVTAFASRVLHSFIVGLGSLDARIVATVCSVLLAVGLAALYLPARWASSVDPLHTLRSE